MPTAPEHAQRGQLQPRWRRALVPAVLGLAVGAALLALVASAAVRTAPGWWRTIPRTDPELLRRAKDVENRITNRVYASRPMGMTGEEPWAIELDAQSANAWLNARLPMWLANQRDQFRWPDELTNLQVAFTTGRVVIGAGVRVGAAPDNPGREQVLTATLDPYVDEAGKLWLPATGVSLGRLDIPGPLVISTVRGRAKATIPVHLRDLPETAALFRAFAGESPIVNSAVFRLGDGRRIRVLAIDCQDDRLTITCRTERDDPRPPDTAPPTNR